MIKQVYFSPKCPICQKSMPTPYGISANVSAPKNGWVVFCQDGAWCHMMSSKDGVERIVYMALVAAKAD